MAKRTVKKRSAKKKTRRKSAKKASKKKTKRKKVRKAAKKAKRKAKKTAKKTKRKKKAAKKEKKYVPSLKLLGSLLAILEHAEDAIKNHNFNLAEVWVNDYVHKIPQEFIDLPLTKAFYHALKDRDIELLEATIEAEIERLRVVKINVLRKKVAKISIV